MNGVRVVAEGLSFPEGPIALPDGSVLLVEIRRGTLTRIAPDGSLEVVAELGGGPNGAAIGPDGAVYVCNNGGFEWHDLGGFTLPGNQPDDYTGGRIQRVDLSTSEVTDLYRECDGCPLRGPNDLVFDDTGGFWFTDHGKIRSRDKDHGGIYYAAADGSAISEVVYPVDSPNGIGLSPSGDRLYYAETYTARVMQRDVESPGRLTAAVPMSRGTMLACLPTLAYFDSLAVDADGNVCVGTLADPGITVVSPSGEVSHRPLPPDLWDPLVTNICFGGPDRRTAYLTLSGTGRLIACEWPTAGLALAH
jgi:gluconolactonase